MFIMPVWGMYALKLLLSLALLHFLYGVFDGETVYYEESHPELLFPEFEKYPELVFSESKHQHTLVFSNNTSWTGLEPTAQVFFLRFAYNPSRKKHKPRASCPSWTGLLVAPMSRLRRDVVKPHVRGAPDGQAQARGRQWPRFFSRFFDFTFDLFFNFRLYFQIL